MTQLWKVRKELGIDTQGLVLRRQQVVLPRQLWARAIDLAHHSHQGENEAKKSCRAENWCLNMDAAVEARMIRYQACGAKEKEQRPTLSDTNIQTLTSWSRVSLDLRKFPNGQLMAILIDSYSKFPVVVTL